MDDLQQLETWVAPLLAKLQPGARRALARKVGIALRRSQHQRVGEQRNPDGSAFLPRKRTLKAGRIKSRKLKMFRRIAKTDYLKAQATEHDVTVGFYGRIARIARVHQEGLADRVSRGGPTVRYERRQLLGFTDVDLRMISDLLIEHLAR
ncbi:phage virion morphogenesis protein [Lysobacter cavernae]|uniref:Phage virion morphogenesis protein n=1 Tax=Lysobacter cavernae TaxID=1685901 RepID=A0ABV7RIJ3_9GAMM